MRITCPKCNAHYEIGEDLIRPEGRDVQCSNCGTTWFQAGRNRPAPAGEAIGRAADEPAGDLEGDEDDDVGASNGDAPAAPPPPPPSGRRPAADKAALDILREERAREDRLRAGMQADSDAAAQVEDMPAREDENRDGGGRRPDSPDRDPREAAAAERVRMAAAASRARARDGSRPAPAPAPGDANAEAGTGSRAEADVRPDGSGASSPAIAAAAGRRGRLTGRALLPDIEEINSSLRPDDPSAADAGDTATRAAPGVSSQAGFRLGFLAVCAIALALVALYAFAEPFGRGMPALAEPMARYVAWVDKSRSELERAVEALTERITPEP